MEKLSNFGKVKLIDVILDAIADGTLDNTMVEDLHLLCFNSEDFIVGNYECIQFIDKHYGSGAFDAISCVVEYEKDNFNNVSTDISSPEKVLNMVVYIHGEELIRELKCLEGQYGDFDDVILFEMRKELLEIKEGLIEPEPLTVEEVLTNSLTLYFEDDTHTGPGQVEYLTKRLLNDLKRSGNLK